MRHLAGVLAVALVFAVIAPAFAHGCGSTHYGYGRVEQKFASEDQFTIRVEGTSYLVPMSFYNRVFVGDVVTVPVFAHGCDRNQYGYGLVEQKFASEDQFTIRVEGTSYTVPMSFYNRVFVGDVVRFSGKEWSIVKHAPTVLSGSK